MLKSSFFTQLKIICSFSIYSPEICQNLERIFQGENFEEKAVILLIFQLLDKIEYFHDRHFFQIEVLLF
jgi:hypothetical protein